MKSNALCCALAVTTLTLVGCTDDDELKNKGPSYSSDPLTVQEVCAAHLSWEAGGETMCVQGNVPSANTLAALGVDPAHYCRPGTPWRKWAESLLAAVNDGRVGIDWSKARECLEVSRTLRASNPGIALLKSAEWAAVRDGACKAFFQGKVAAAGTCKEDWDCPAGMGCYTSTPNVAASKTCQAPKTMGATCDGEYFPCAKGLRCNPDDNTCTDQLLEEGEFCGGDNDCASGKCDSSSGLPMCTATGEKQMGASCAEDAECAGAGACATCRASAAGGATTCQIAGAQGEYCDDWGDCAMDLGCTSNVCSTVGEGVDCYGPSQSVCASGLACVATVDCSQYDDDQTACEANKYCYYDQGICDVGMGVCVKPPESGACAYGLCAMGKYCDPSSDTCVARAALDQLCTTDGAGAPVCLEGLGCIGGYCKRPCEVNEDCGAGKYCDTQLEVAECKALATSSCASTVECAADKYCHTGDLVCPSYATETACGADPLCLWNVTGTCDPVNDCSLKTTEPTCAGDSDCAWQPIRECASTCAENTDPTTCNNTTGCHYYDDDDACDSACYQFDGNAGGCAAVAGCTYDAETGYCDPPNICAAISDLAVCDATSGCQSTVVDGECINVFDCTALDQTACQADSRCAFSEDAACEPARPGDPGECLTRIGVGQPVLGECSLLNGNAWVGAGYAESCEKDSCYVGSDGSAVCAVDAQYGCASSRNLASILGLTFLFGLVLMRRRKQ